MVKNTLKLALIIGLLFWFPTGMIDDFFITIPLINGLGLKLYLILSGIIVYILYINIEGRTIKDKLGVIRKEIKSVL